MVCLHSSLPARCVLAVVVAWFVLEARDAQACGGCFHEQAPVSVVDTSFVTDHRMAFSMSTSQTVLWDQVHFSGSPKDFAWVLPVKPGARIELSHDEWIAALDASTRTVITGPTPRNCGGGAPTEYESGGGGGCGFGGFSADTAGSATSVDAGAETSQVQVISQEVVGPYDAVTVRSSQGEALGDWLRANGYALPASIQPTVDAYASAGFDFIALKLAPAAGVQAMRPVRVVTPGADPTLPLRMVAAGVGSHVGLELYVLSEGRYHPANFPDRTIDFTKLAWDPNAGRSNYTELVQQALGAGDGTGWLTESSQVANMYALSGPNPGLAVTYQSTCQTQVFLPTCPNIGSNGASAEDAASAPDTAAAADVMTPNDAPGAAESATATVSEAGVDAMLATDGSMANEAAGSGGGGLSSDASGPSNSVASGTCAPPMVHPCDDLSVAMVGITPGNLWVTRLRADFPSAALASDLALEATASQTSITNQHTTNVYTIPNYNPCASASSSTTTSSPRPSPGGGCACRSVESRRDRYSEAILLSMGAVAFALSLRRRRARTAIRVK